MADIRFYMSDFVDQIILCDYAVFFSMLMIMILRQGQ